MLRLCSEIEKKKYESNVLVQRKKNTIFFITILNHKYTLF